MGKGVMLVKYLGALYGSRSQADCHQSSSSCQIIIWLGLSQTKSIWHGVSFASSVKRGRLFLDGLVLFLRQGVYQIASLRLIITR